MKRSKIYLLTKFSERDLELLKLDLFDHALNNALRIKHLKIPKVALEALIKKSIEGLMLSYKLEDGHSLGELLKKRVLSDLKAEYAKTHPTKLDKVKWPDLTIQTLKTSTRKSIKKHKLQELFKIRTLAKKKRSELQFFVATKLNKRQDLLLSTILSTKEKFSHTELSKKLDVGRSTVTNDIRILHQYILVALERIKAK